MKVLLDQHSAVVRSWDKFRLNRETPWGLIGHDTGHHYLNMMMGGWQPGKLTTIGARAGIGKTAMVVQMFQAGARVTNNRRAEFLFFTWEMSPEYIVDRHVCNRVGITLPQLIQGAKLLPDHTVELIKKSYDDADKLPVTYHIMSLSIDEVKETSKRFIEKCNKKSKIEGIEILPVIVIDYVGMAKFDKYGPRTYGIGEFMYGCKQTASQQGCSFVVFSQINRAADARDVPTRADFSDSQAIEQASDNLILLHRPEYHGVNVIKDPKTGIDVPSEGKALIKVLKSRDYGVADTLINCDVKYYRFWSEGMRWDDEYWHKYSDENFWLEQLHL